MHSGTEKVVTCCVARVGQHGAARSSRLARHARHARHVARVVMQQVEFELNCEKYLVMLFLKVSIHC